MREEIFCPRKIWESLKNLWYHWHFCLKMGSYYLSSTFITFILNDTFCSIEIIYNMSSDRSSHFTNFFSWPIWWLLMLPNHALVFLIKWCSYKSHVIYCIIHRNVFTIYSKDVAYIPPNKTNNEYKTVLLNRHFLFKSFAFFCTNISLYIRSCRQRYLWKEAKETFHTKTGTTKRKGITHFNK